MLLDRVRDTWQEVAALQATAQVLNGRTPRWQKPGQVTGGGRDDPLAEITQRAGITERPQSAAAIAGGLRPVEVG